MKREEINSILDQHDSSSPSITKLVVIGFVLISILYVSAEAIWEGFLIGDREEEEHKYSYTKLMVFTWKSITIKSTM